jgi:hypothetical protein
VANFEKYDINSAWTLINPEHWKNEFNHMGGGAIKLDITTFSSFFAVGGNTSLQQATVMLEGWSHPLYYLEIFDSAAPDAEPIGLWALLVIPSDDMAQLVRVDGEASGAGLPAHGWFRLLRLASVIGSKVYVNFDGFPPPPVIEYPVSGGVRVFSPGRTTYGGNPVPNHAFSAVVNSDDDGAFGMFRKLNDGTVWAPFALIGDGTVLAPADPATPGTDGLRCRDGFRCPSTKDYKYEPAKTFYHQISLSSGLPLIRSTGLPTTFWSYNAPTNSPPGIWFINDAGPLSGEDILVFPVNLPHGSTIIEFAVQYNCLAAPTNLNPSAVLYRKPRLNANAWVVGSTVAWEVEDALRTLSPMATVSGLANYFVYGSSVATGNDVVDNELHEYFVVVKAADTGLDRLHGIRISFTMPAVAPA